MSAPSSGTSTPDSALPPRKIYDLKDYTPTTTAEPFNRDYTAGIPIAIDLGSHTTRVGLTNSTTANPSNVYPTLLAKWRDRKIQKTYTFIGNDVFLDPAIKAQAKTPYDGAFLTNWDYVELMFDYAFHHAGVSSNGAVDNPVIITERPATPLLQRKNFYELLYETYNVNKVAFGIDSLFSFYQNNGQNGLVIGTGHESTHVIPVINGRGVMTEAKRINWGGHQSSNYLSSLLQLKYPYFPTKLNNYQVDNLVKDFCYVSKNYDEDLKVALNLDTLEDLNVTIEAPFTEVEKIQKTEEELARQAAKRKESGRRLQEQAQQKRLEKLIQKEQEFEYFTSLKSKISTLSKKSQLATYKEEGFDNEDDFNKYLNDLDKALKRARKQDIGDDSEDTSKEPPSFPLVDVPDEGLSEDQLKEKRKQKLMKANHDARQRAKVEKEQERLRLEKEAEEDAKWRERDLKTWIHDRRTKLKVIVQKRKDRQKLKEQLNDRKSLAAQIRMKNITTLASDEKRSAGTKRRRTGTSIDNDPNDTFGANDDDWGIYRDIANVDDEEVLEEEEQQLVRLEKELLEHDPSFTEEDTLEAQYDWRKSTLHLFYRGPRPFNSEDSHENHQIHLNIERIRVPEVLFQPNIAGLDQTGIVEISENLILNSLDGKGFSGDSYNALQDVFLTGGQALFPNFTDRIHSEFKQFLPVGSPLHVRMAADPLTDAWRGMAKWSQSEEASKSYITKQEYEEYGPDYIKEHNLGNVSVLK
jgi:actin-related protein 5